MSDNCTEEEKKYCEKFIYKNACKDGKCYNPKRKQVSNSKKSTSAQKVPNIPVPNISVPNIQKAPEVIVDVIKTKKTILDFIKELGKRKYKTAKEVIESIFNNDDGNEISKK